MRRVLGGVVVACIVGAAALLATRGHADGFGFKGKLEVRVLQLGYLPATKTLIVRVQPVAPAASVVEYQTADPENIDRLMRLAEMKNRGARLAVELDSSKIKMIDVAIGGPLLVSQDE